MTSQQREFFKAIAENLISVGRIGSSGYRRSLGAVGSHEAAQALGTTFMNWVKRNYPQHTFRLSGVEGTGGTSNLRVRVYLAK